MAAKRNKQSMAEKIVVQRRDNEMASRIVGTIFIIVGVILVGLGIYSFVTYNVEPVLDLEIGVPVLNEIEGVTNDTSITLTGTAEDVRKVRIFLNDEVVETVKVESKEFSYEWEIEDEGIYVIEVDGLKGFPKQKKSDTSEPVIVTVDWTAPSSDISVEYVEETSKSSFVLAGSTEVNTNVYVKRGIESFNTISDENGDFELVVDLSDEGKNVFSILLVDEAGNETTADEKIRITYSPDGSVNGDGTSDISDGEIPEASGNLTEALEEVLSNQLMMLFGFLGIVTMIVTSLILVKKRKIV